MTTLKTVIGLLLFSVSVASFGTEKLVFGVVPQQAASKEARQWGPIMNYLSDKTGLHIQFATAPSIPEFEHRLARGDYDIAYMNPYHYTLFQRHTGYAALAKASNRRIKGIMVVKKTSQIDSLHDLKETRLAFPAPLAFAATLLTKAHLQQAGIPFKAHHVSTHDSVYRSVAQGLYPAGGGIMRTLNSLDKGVRDQLRVLWTSKGFTPHAIATHPRVSAPHREKILETLIDISNNDAGTLLLSPLNITGFEPANDADWDDVRALNIQPEDS